MDHQTNIIIADIANKSAEYDASEIYNTIIQQVDNGEYDTCLEAFSNYIEEHDMDMNTINKYVSPALRSILFKEACVRNLIYDPPKSNIKEEVFE